VAHIGVLYDRGYILYTRFQEEIFLYHETILKCVLKCAIIGTALLVLGVHSLELVLSVEVLITQLMIHDPNMNKTVFSLSEHSNYLSKKEVLEMQLYIQPIALITNF
jgi:hypothetical protein